MKSKAKLVSLICAFCFVLATCLCGVFAIKNFSLVSGGVIKFVAPGVDATISAATLSGLSKKEGSATMSSFTVTPNMTTAQIEALSGYQSWSGIYLLFDDDSEGVGSISFTITNNSSKSTENIMVKISTNTTEESPIQVTPCADFCVNTGTSHTFEIGVAVSNMAESVKIEDFEMTVELSAIKASNVVSVSQYSTEGLTVSTNSTAKTATITNATMLEVTALVKDANGVIYTVTEIAEDAFVDVANLVELTIPNTVTKIGEFAFAGSNISGTLVIPDSVTVIEQSAFKNCKKLAGVIFSKNITEIKEHTFYGCAGLESLEIPSNITSLGDYSFQNCTTITGAVRIPSSVTYMGLSLFEGCTSITSVIVESVDLTLKDSAFFGCTAITSVTFTSETPINYTGSYTFHSSTNYPIYVPGSSVEAYKTASTNWSKLASRIKAIPGNEPGASASNPIDVANVPNLTFDTANANNGCISVTNNGATGAVNIPAYVKQNNVTYTVTEITDYSFMENTSITSLTIPDTVTRIGMAAFAGCTGLTGELIIPDSVTEIDSGAFMGCTGLTGALVIPSSITQIESYVFQGCTGFSSVVIPDSVTSIGSDVFSGCTGLQTVEIGNGVSSFGMFAFAACSSLTSITIKAVTPPQLYTQGTYFVDTNECPIYVPAGSVDTYKSQYGWNGYDYRIQAIPA